MAVGLPAKTTYVNGDVFSASDINDTNGTINLTAAPFAAGKNRLINGNMAVAQRGTSFTASNNNDDAYTLDRWYILSDTNDVIDVTRATDVPTNGLYSIGLDVETVNKKFGIAQIIEQQNSIGLIGNTVTLSFKAKVSSTTKLDNVKAAIVAWSGTADAVTSDIISAWGVEGTNPTLIANATYENTPANLGVTTSWASYSITAAIDTASTKNILVFIWSDVTDTTLGDFLYVTDAQLEAGSTATGFQTATGTIQGELAACQRYFYRLGNTVANEMVGIGGVFDPNFCYPIVFFPVELRGTPTFSFSAAADFTAQDGTTNAVCTSITANVLGTKTASFSAGTGSPLVTGRAVRVYRTGSASGSFIQFNSEL
jgi:hypothetical protein